MKIYAGLVLSIEKENGESIDEIDTETSATVGSIRRLIRNQLGHNRFEMRYRGRLLNNDRERLSDCGLDGRCIQSGTITVRET